MRIVGELTTRLEEEGSDEKEPTSEVLVDGRATGRFVPGAVLEAAIQWENYYLLFMTGDVPYEEMLRVVLLDDQFGPVRPLGCVGGPLRRTRAAGHSARLCPEDTVLVRAYRSAGRS